MPSAWILCTHIAKLEKVGVVSTLFLVGWVWGVSVFISVTKHNKCKTFGNDLKALWPFIQELYSTVKRSIQKRLVELDTSNSWNTSTSVTANKHCGGKKESISVTFLENLNFIATYSGCLLECIIIQHLWHLRESESTVSLSLSYSLSSAREGRCCSWIQVLSSIIKSGCRHILLKESLRAAWVLRLS